MPVILPTRTVPIVPRRVRALYPLSRLAAFHAESEPILFEQAGVSPSRALTHVPQPDWNL